MLRLQTVFTAGITWLLIFIIIFFGLTLLKTAPNLPKSLAYGFLRKAVMYHASWSTRNWPSLQSEHFMIRFTEQDRSMAPMVLSVAEEDYGAVAAAFDFKQTGKIPVIMYPDREGLGRSFGWESDESAMGVYWAGVIRILTPREWVEEGEDVEATFRSMGPMAHEFTHLVVDYRTGGNYPRWFTEGVAQLMEYRLTGFVFSPSSENDLRQELYHFADMDAGYDSLPNQSLAYRQSLKAVEYLVEVYGEDGLYLVLDQLARGKTMDRALAEVTGGGLKQFEKDFRSWIVRTNLHFLQE